MSTPDLSADRVEAKERINEGETKNTTAPAEPVTVAPTDPADDFHGPEEVPGNRDDVDVPLAEGKPTDDGKGDEEVPPADFQSYEDSSADDGQEQN